MLVSPKAPTFGAGAKTGHEKITIFSGALKLKNIELTGR